MKKIVLSIALVATSIAGFAQIGVGTLTPEAALDVVSTDSGFLMPRMDSETAVTTPVEGMQVYNTTTKKVMLFDGTNWVVDTNGSQWTAQTGFIEATNAKANGNNVSVADDGTMAVGNVANVLAPEAQFTISAKPELIAASGSTQFGQITEFNFLPSESAAITKVIGSSTIVNLRDAVNTNSFEGVAVFGLFNNESSGGNSTIANFGSQTGNGMSPNRIRVIDATHRFGGGSNVIGEVSVVRANIDVFGSDANSALTGSVGDIYGLQVNGTAFRRTSANIANKYGIYVDQINASTVAPGALAYSIYTRDGKVSLGDDVEQRGTGFFKVASGTTAQRPATPEFGMIRYNSTTGRGEMYVNDSNADGTQGDAGWRAL